MNPEIEHERSVRRVRDRQRARQRIERGEEPWLGVVGVLAVVEAVRDVEFPATREAIRRRAGERYVQASARLVLPVAEVLAHMTESSFDGLREFQTAVQRHWPGIRYLEVPEEQRPRPRRAARSPRRTA